MMMIMMIFYILLLLNIIQTASFISGDDHKYSGYISEQCWLWTFNWETPFLSPCWFVLVLFPASSVITLLVNPSVYMFPQTCIFLICTFNPTFLPSILSEMFSNSTQIVSVSLFSWKESSISASSKDYLISNRSVFQNLTMSLSKYFTTTDAFKYFFHLNSEWLLSL